MALLITASLLFSFAEIGPVTITTDPKKFQYELRELYVQVGSAFRTHQTRCNVKLRQLEIAKFAQQTILSTTKHKQGAQKYKICHLG